MGHGSSHQAFRAAKRAISSRRTKTRRRAVFIRVASTRRGTASDSGWRSEAGTVLVLARHASTLARGIHMEEVHNPLSVAQVSAAPLLTPAFRSKRGAHCPNLPGKPAPKTA